MTGLRHLAIAIGLLALAVPAQAQDYPSRLVRIIVPFGAGGPADVTARLIAKDLQESLKQPFVVENKPGAGAVIGTIEAAKSAPDGYTLLMMSNAQTANESLLPQRNYELMRDFTPVAPVNTSDLVIAVHPSVKAATLQEFIALAKSQPGQLNYASSGQGTPYHLAGELFKSMTGTDIVHVPHRGSGEARNNLIGGQIEMMIDAVTTMAPNIAAGQVRALATTGKTRTPVLPDVPTVAEAGVAGYEATIWLGIMAPAGTPKRLCRASIVAFAMVVLPATAFPQGKYPDRPIKMIIPLAAASAVDVAARIVTQKMAENMGQNFVILNQPGASGTIGAEQVARATPDGYTIGGFNDSIMTMVPALQTDLRWDILKDFEPITLVATVEWGLIANEKAGFKTAADLIAAAKAAPGKIDYGSGGIGSPQHLAMELFAAGAGIKLTHVPYRGATQAASDVVAGQIPVAFQGLGV